MEISVQGKATSFYTPNQVILNLRFVTKEQSYEEALASGSANVLGFINTILLKYGFQKEDMKTNTFYIQEEKKYDDDTNTYKLIGYIYHQNATLKFEYDKEKLSSIMEDISKMAQPPFFEVNFTIKDLEKCKKDNLTKAYKDAEMQAFIIAQAAGTTLKQCIKTDFKPFTTDYISNGYNSEILYKSKDLYGLDTTNVSDTINTVFTPEDVMISETLYCLWVTE